MKILLLGKNGQVGWELQRALAPLGELIACDFDTAGDLKADFAQPESLAPLIRVNTVCPGYIASGWFTKYQGSSTEEQTAEAVAKTTPLKVASMPEDIAETILFFAGPESRHVTGEFIIVDAGMHLN